MARIRTIKPSFFTSEAVVALPLRVRLTWIGLWTHCDDKGRCRDNARLVKAAVWPLEDEILVRDIEDDLSVLAVRGRILRYRVGGQGYLQITGWKDHQKINRPAGSELPAPPIDTPPDGAHGVLSEGSVRAPSEASGTGFMEPSRSPHGTISEGSVRAHGTGRIREETQVLPQVSRISRRAHGGLTEDSVRAHGGLTEGSPWEVEVEVEGKGRKPKPSEADASGASAPRDQQPTLALVPTPPQAVTPPVEPPKITGQTVVQAWVDACRSNGTEPSKSQRGQVGRTASELLEKNDPQLVLGAAEAAGAKGYPSIDRELTAMSGRVNGRHNPNRQHQPYRNPSDDSAYFEEIL